MDARENWVYFLKLSRDLPQEYLLIDQELKQYGKSLVPVTLKGLIDTASKSSSVHIVIYIKSLSDLSYFNRRVNKILKYLMRNSMVNLYIASSFANIGDGSILKKGQYNFVKLPVSKKAFGENVSRMVDMRENDYYKWPGGRRPKMTLAS